MVHWTIADEREKYINSVRGEYVYDPQNAAIIKIKTVLKEMNENGDIDSQMT